MRILKLHLSNAFIFGFLLNAFLINAQDFPSELKFYEFGFGYNFTGESIHVPLYGRYIYEPNPNYEFGLEAKFNVLSFGTYDARFSPFQNADSYRDNFENMFSGEAYALVRRRLFKKNRYFGLGLALGSSNNIAKEIQEPNGQSDLERLPLFDLAQKAIVPSIGIKWQERWRNWIHNFGYYIPVSKNGFRLSPSLNYSVGYRFPFEKFEEEDIDELLWKSISKDTSTFKKIGLSFGTFINMPINNYASAPILDYFGELKVMPWNYLSINFKYNKILGANREHQLGDDKNFIETFRPRTNDSNISKEITSYTLGADYYFWPREIDWFAGAGLGYYHRNAMVQKPVFIDGAYELRYLLPERTNVGAYIRTGYQVGNFRHTIEFHYSGKQIPDFFTTTLGLNLYAFKLE